MIIKKVLLFFLILGIIFPFVSSAHYIIGYVNDALDGMNSDGQTVILWNPFYGIGDNLIDVVGGLSGQESMYMIDCEMLQNGCRVGDVLSIRVIDTGNGYISYVRNVTVTGAGFDIVQNITLNSPPQIFLNSPQTNYAINKNPVPFNCSFFDLDGPSGNLSLWGNWSGFWAEEQRREVSFGNLTHVFNENLGEGIYVWACVSEDNLSVSTFGENRTLIVDFTTPIISGIFLNESFVCGNNSLRITCDTLDNNWVEKVFLEINTPSLLYNQTMNFLGGTNYSSDVLINEFGNWGFKCFSRDNAGNHNSLSPPMFFSYSTYPELFINSSRINFNPQKPIEGANVNVFVTIENRGCIDSGLFNVSFFKENVSLQNQLGQNRAFTLSSFSELIINFTYSAFIGKNNIFAFIDSTYEIIEKIESDNIGNNSIQITSWQKFYGNVSAVKILGSEKNMTVFGVEEQIVGNVFITDMEANVDWFSLKPLGENLTGSSTLNDFVEIDSFFGTTNLNDSLYNEFLDRGQIKYKSSFLVNKKEINNVPVINSTNNEIFLTGILWDSSDDNDGEFSTTDKEDLVFITKINENKTGKYGNYDYEFRIPVTLRNYNPTDNSEIYLYFNLI